MKQYDKHIEVGSGRKIKNYSSSDYIEEFGDGHPGKHSYVKDVESDSRKHHEEHDDKESP